MHERAQIASNYPKMKLNIQSRKSFQMPLSQNERIPDIPMEFWQLLNCFMHVIGEMIMELQSRQIAIHHKQLMYKEYVCWHHIGCLL